MANMTTSVQYIKGIGEQRAKSLHKLGITNLRELISYFPRAYEDRRRAYLWLQLQLRLKGATE